MVKKKIGGNQRISRKFKMDMFVGRRIEAVFLVNREDGIKQIAIRDTLERRTDPSSAQGYYLQRAGILLPLNSSRHDGYSGSSPRLYVKASSAIESKLREIGKL